jgi:hypothetical protein
MSENTGTLKELIETIRSQKEHYCKWVKDTFKNFHKNLLNLSEEESERIFYSLTSLGETELSEIENLSIEDRLNRFKTENSTGYKIRVFVKSENISQRDVLIIPSQWFLKDISENQEILEACSELANS